MELDMSSFMFGLLVGCIIGMALLAYVSVKYNDSQERRASRQLDDLIAEEARLAAAMRRARAKGVVDAEVLK